ncbi:MAG: putative quinol monooxygenase [Pseudomonadales bacterium]
MIIVHGTIPIKPESRDTALDLARRMSEATRSEEGCISYDFYVGLSDPNTLLLFQEWEDMESLMGHFKTEHMESFLQDLPDVLDGEITTRRYAVQAVEETDDFDDEEPEELPPVIH